jgi:hypothetical protein
MDKKTNQKPHFLIITKPGKGVDSEINFFGKFILCSNNGRYSRRQFEVDTR